MKVGLYSDRARRAVTEVRAWISQQGFEPTPAGIRACRQAIIARRHEPPFATVTGFRDFYSLSTCRDLLFHVMEHDFTLPQIKQALAELGLEFLGFEMLGNAITTFRREFAEPSASTDLDAWDRFEERHPSTFVGMYQFWCRK